MYSIYFLLNLQEFVNHSNDCSLRKHNDKEIRNQHTWTTFQEVDFRRCSEPFLREQDSSCQVILYLLASLLIGQTRRALTSPQWQFMRRTWRPACVRSHLRERLSTSASMKGHCFRWLSQITLDLEGRLREGLMSYHYRGSSQFGTLPYAI